MKRFCLLLTSLFFSAVVFAQPVSGSFYDFIDQTQEMPVKPNPTTLIIYRLESRYEMNEIRCWLKLEDENGNDVTYTSAKAAYEWPVYKYWDPYKTNRTLPQTFTQREPDLIPYRKKYYLSGGMAMHLNLKKGKYKISLYTPIDQQNNFEYPTEGQRAFEWHSNVFEYDTENPTNVLFVTPVTDENGFYNGGWLIDYKQPVQVTR
ncbi:hypothetical protein [Treponema sp. Marseille-Q3903]|uniref:hypothetical protein n=1 Tax=Treponema sp. Marseille-Q3903 TaxID=2766703 RepID=UPI001652A48F|nr:hypothetical protein [Treponema sp. Marseille-Q3903]MBC6712936.1 hypothetical protein [Treponema sp. Marseille-Q3903]